MAASHGLEVVELEYVPAAKQRALRVFVEKNAAERARLAEAAKSVGAESAAEEGAIPVAVANGQITMDQLAWVTHQDREQFSVDFGTLVDVKDMVPGAEYTLEVSSPGLERGLGNEFHAGQHRVLPERIEKPGTGVEAVAVAPERDTEIEAETVDVERRDPVAQRIHHHLQHARMREVQRVAGAGIIDAMAPVARHQTVIARIVEPAKRQGRPEFAAFGGVIVDDVENDFDAGRVQATNRDAHLGGGAGRKITRLDGEEPDRVIAPVIAQAASATGGDPE